MSPEAWEKLADRSFDAILLIVGAAIAAGVQAVFSSQAKKDDRLTLAYSVLLKARVATTYLLHVHGVMVASRTKAGSEGRDLWQRLGEFVGAEKSNLEVNTEEFVLFASSRQFELFSRVVELFDAYNVIVSLVKMYNLQMHALHSANYDTIETGGSDGITAMETEDQRVLLIVTKLSNLALEMERNAKEAMGDPVDTAKILGPRLRELLKDKRFGEARLEFPLANSAPPPATSTDKPS